MKNKFMELFAWYQSDVRKLSSSSDYGKQIENIYKRLDPSLAIYRSDITQADNKRSQPNNWESNDVPFLP